MSVNGISNATKIEQTNVSHALDYLFRSNLVKLKIQGKLHIYSINGEVKPFIKDILKNVKKHEAVIRKVSATALVAAYIAVSLQNGNPPATLMHLVLSNYIS